jgi:anti-sigma regulatory factor (Ser/Thr protein kinase)
LSVDEREIGGLGIFMVKNIMDSVEYRREGRKNVLTIKKVGSSCVNR